MHSVAIVRKNNYSDVRKEIEKGFEALGGISDFIKPGEKILLKPNLLKSSTPEGCATTHPEIIKAFIEIIKDAGAVPLLGDNPAMGNALKVFISIGLEKYIFSNNIRIVECVEPIIKRKKISDREIKFTVFKGIDEADKIFTLAKLKTHAQMLYTGAVKNLFGLVPGGLKPELHFKYQRYENFAEMIVDLYDLINPDFAIIDAITAMEGNGPGSGTPRNINCIILSKNALAADICAAKIIGYDISDIPILNIAASRKLGPAGLSEISIKGEALENFTVPDFKKIPKTKTMTNFAFAPARKILEKLVLSKPLVNHNKCVKCGHCIEICHGKFVGFANNKIVFDYKKCIRCYCCQEICPAEAISVYKPPLLKCLSKIMEKL